jgi:hypothetical protein
MKRNEIVADLEAARRAAVAFRNENLKKALSESERQEVREVEDAAKRLLKALQEAYMMGPAGAACACCNGTGRS